MTALRQQFSSELDQLRLQVEVMGVRVAENLDRMKDVLQDGDVATAERMLRADDDIDAMNVSLTESCYDVLRREAPVAADLRLVVSVLRQLDGPLATRTAICAFAVGRSVERIGDHAVIMGARLRYLITGDPAHLAAEVR